MSDEYVAVEHEGGLNIVRPQHLIHTFTGVNHLANEYVKFRAEALRCHHLLRSVIYDLGKMIHEGAINEENVKAIHSYLERSFNEGIG